MTTVVGIGDGTEVDERADLPTEAYQALVALDVHGVASHSGGSKPSPNAIDKAAHLICELGAAELPDGASGDFPLPGQVTVTAIDGGQGYSVTPDLCTLNIGTYRGGQLLIEGCTAL